MWTILSMFALDITTMYLNNKFKKKGIIFPKKGCINSSRHNACTMYIYICICIYVYIYICICIYVFLTKFLLILFRLVCVKNSAGNMNHYPRAPFHLIRCRAGADRVIWKFWFADVGAGWVIFMRGECGSAKI